MFSEAAASASERSAMRLEIRRIVLFTSDMAGKARFYREGRPSTA